MLLAGRQEQARELIRLNTAIIRASGCDTLLLTCPICYRIFKENYKLDGIRVAVLRASRCCRARVAACASMPVR